MKATEYIKKRKDLDNELSKYWDYIQKTNVAPKNFEHKYDLKALYGLIQNLAEDRAMAKLTLAYINLGFTKKSDINKDVNQYTVFLLSEMTEIRTKLSKIKYINPALKAKKGKNKLAKKEVLTKSWIDARTREIDLRIAELRSKIDEFNKDTDVTEDTVHMSLAA